MRKAEEVSERGFVDAFCEKVSHQIYEQRSLENCSHDLLTSLWQKAIRRGDVDYAMSAAHKLVKEDARYFWRRIKIIALEDVGLANLDLVTQVIAVAGKSALQRKVGFENCALTATRLLADSFKSRSACDLVSLTSAVSGMTSLRNSMAAWGTRQLADFISDEDQLLHERMAAAQVIGGHVENTFAGYRTVHAGSAAAREIWLERSLAPDSIKFVVRRGRDSYGLNSALLLVFELFGGSSLSRTTTKYLDKSPITSQGIPAYAYCMYTSQGRASLSKWLTGDATIRGWLEKSSASNPARALGYAVFQTEGAALNPQLASDQSDSLQRSADSAELIQLGIASILHEKFLSLVRSRLHNLNECRERAATKCRFPT